MRAANVTGVPHPQVRIGGRSARFAHRPLHTGHNSFQTPSAIVLELSLGPDADRTRCRWTSRQTAEYFTAITVAM